VVGGAADGDYTAAIGEAVANSIDLADEILARKAAEIPDEDDDEPIGRIVPRRLRLPIGVHESDRGSIWGGLGVCCHAGYQRPSKRRYSVSDS